MTRRRLGSIRKLGENRYEIDVTVNGDRRYAVVRGTERDAEMELARLTGKGAPPSTTWREFWEHVVDPSLGGLAEHTVHEYRRLWRKELEPRIGDEPVSSMDWHRANEVITSVEHPSMQRHVGALLRKMCNMAIRDRGHLLMWNPVDRAIRYKPYRKRPKKLVLSEDVYRFMEQIRGIKYEPLLLLELGCGLRPEEARALLWEDISPFELKGSTYCAVNVDKAITVVDSRPVYKETKTAGSDRTAVCGEPFASRVLAIADGKTGPLCPSGAPWDEKNPAAWYTSPQTVAHNWRQWCERHDMPYIADREMRSSYATMMGEAGAPDSVVAGNMGHSDGTVKGEHYQRITMRAKCMAADLLAESLADFAPVSSEKSALS